MKLKNTFKQSWKIVWQNPVLWFFGFFALIFMNNEFVLITTNFNKISKWIDNLINFKIFKYQNFLNNFNAQSFLDPLFFWTTSLIVLGLIVILLFSIFSQIILIKIIKKIKEKKEIKIKEFLKKSTKSFSSIVLIYLIYFFIIYGFIYLLNTSLLFDLSVPIIFYVIIFLIIGFILSFVFRFAIFFLVLEKNKLLKALKNGILLFFKNWTQTIKTSFLLLVFLFLFLFLISIILYTTGIPFGILLKLFLSLKIYFGFYAILFMWLILYTIIVIFSFSFVSCFQFSVWTLFFIKTINKSVKKEVKKK